MDKVDVGHWIYVGTSHIPAYVISVISDNEVSAGYYQNNSKAIKEEFVNVDGMWCFKHSGPSGSYLTGSIASIVKRGPAS
ncbi:hypothetical protein O4H50_21085 [Vibrio diazotrophicus]|uniref:hypothetical protein n=1 Tax=Vibrio diazotrophicus TaxID=685 RepID=UPI0022AE6352|nr:hypothetical protein [Vibrio diazotrophicus]MCZ4374286.1 hypothetical protein [Vibrio diazotrophicus]